MDRLASVLFAVLRGLVQAACIVALTFFLCRVMPGDVVDVLGLEGGLTADQQVEMRRALGLDQPLLSQFVTWVSHALQGDFGRSLRFDQPVSDMLANALPVTLRFAFLSFAFGVGLALLLAIAATAFRSRWLDGLIDGINIWSIAVPTFCAGFAAILIFSIWLGWLPVIGGLLMPVIIIGLDNAGQIVKSLREELKEAVMLPHVRTARAKGLSPWRIAIAHVLPAAAPIMLALSGLALGGLVAGSLTMEVLFALPGIGSLTLNAIHGRDYPIILAAVTVIAVALVLINTVIDILHRLIDPRLA
ncbi:MULTISPECIES: ABC transporter permease [Bosea]|jgi:peptide/nickel transport system permease protein|uniref:Peptide/nickel transport system permease protein n=1 Tax=Bosea robiniae TaxID=1036780 RepID=A0ABY0PAK1_9HYPH|nr:MULTISPECIES: ABC transporter permease [Bosea]TQI74361.1 peptide/nickel transport system permease protein [Bosea sp. AK1]SDH77356.1 peptide/nickel transport system permease protein [Bosea robiniae]